MFYRVVLNGSIQGQDVRNTLYYRTGVGFDVSGISLAGAEALANMVESQVVPKYLDVLPTTYTLDTIDVYPVNDQFQLVYQNPFTKRVLDNGTRVGPVAGTATVAIIKFNLESTTIVNGIKPPKRGYIAVGPLLEAWIGDDGKLDASLFTDPARELNQLADAVGQNLESLIPPVIFYPVRMKAKRGILEDFTAFESFADVSGAVCRQVVSWRRSRMPES